jgi:hypothetical protein
MSQLLAIGLVLVMAALSLVAASLLRDRGVPPPTTRWLASVIGGFAYVVAVNWLDAGIALALSAVCLAVVAALRARRPCLLRGLRLSPRRESRAELGYPAAATLALAVGCVARHDPRLALVAIACMAWGDASAGLVRDWRPGSLPHRVAASAAMLSVSLASAWLLYPSVAGVAAAFAATGAEALWPLTRSSLSDSWPVVGTALAVITLV